MKNPSSARCHSVGSASVCAIVAGQVYCWGANNSQPGMAKSRVNPKGCAQDARNNSQPGMAKSRVNPKGCAQDARNNFGQLGNNTSTGSSTPILTTIPAPGATSVGRGDNSCAVVGGEAYCWARNTGGQCGTGDYLSPVLQPTKVVFVP